MANRTLTELADDALDAVSDLLDEGQYDCLRASSDMDKVRYRYCHADCDLFADTVSAITGWPIVAVSSPDGPLHRLVRMPVGAGSELVDVTGFVTEADLQRRYGTEKLTIGPGALFGGASDDYDHLAVVRLFLYLDYPPFSGLDFQRQLLAFGATLEVGPDDLPAPVDLLQLEHAPRENNVVTVNRFLAQMLADPPRGSAVAQYQKAITTCGYRASEKGHTEVVRAFLNATDVPITFEDGGYTWLHVAAISEAVATIRLLLTHPRSAHLVNMTQKDDARVPLNLAALFHRRAGVAALLAGGAAVDVQMEKTGHTPLHACLSSEWGSDGHAQQLATAELLLSQGASPLLFDQEGNAALHWTAKAGQMSLAQSLVEKGVPVDHTGPDNGVPPIFRAVETGHTDMIEVLRALGADTAAYSSDGNTLLTHCIVAHANKYDKAHPAVREHSLTLKSDGLRMIQHLLDVVGLDPDQPNLHGDMPELLAKDFPDVRLALHVCRARRAMAGVLATARPDGASPRPPVSRQP